MYMSSWRVTASFTLGVVSVIVWIIAEIPQIITNYRAKSTEGLSATFLSTWIIADLLNLFGCLLEPATLPTQLYIAVLYTIITMALGSQTIYYAHIYPQLKYKKQLKYEQVETDSKVGQVEKISDAEQTHEFDGFRRDNDPSSPIPLPACPQIISTGTELFYQSARSLSKSQTPTAGCILAQRMSTNSSLLDPIQENVLGSANVTKSAPTLKIKSTLCVVSALTFLGAINLNKSLDKRINAVVSNQRQQFVVYVRRKLFQFFQKLQASGDRSLENGASGIGSGAFLGWAMTFVYLCGRLPQICLNIRRGHVEGLNPLMFLFALLGNATYVASILVNSMEWITIKPNLPWLVDAGGYFDAVFILLLSVLLTLVESIETADIVTEEETRTFRVRPEPDYFAKADIVSWMSITSFQVPPSDLKM